MTTIENQNSKFILPGHIRNLIEKKKDSTRLRYMTIAVFMAIIMWFQLSHVGHQQEINTLANARINEYANRTVDLCIFHHASMVHLASNQLRNIMVVKQKTGDILQNATLACSPGYLIPQLKGDSKDYCNELLEYINNTIPNSHQQPEATMLTMFNRGSITNRVMECTVSANESTIYIHHGYMAHLFPPVEDYIDTYTVVWIVCYALYILLCYYDYKYVCAYSPPVPVKLPEDSECYIMYETIKQGDAYYKCYKCVAVYGYNAIKESWLRNAKKCPYCSCPIKYLTRFINSEA